MNRDEGSHNAMLPVVKFSINSEHDAINSRRLAQHVADLAGLTAQNKTRLATAVSEIARNALRYARGGALECNVFSRRREQHIQFVISDEGPGIENIDEILAGRYSSRSGMGVGMHGSSKLVDDFSVETTPGLGTRVLLSMSIPSERVTPEVVDRWREALVDEASRSEVWFEESAQSDARALRVARLKEKELQQQLMEVEKRHRELVAAQEKLMEQATEDALTGLANRRAVMQELEKELSRANRFERPLCIAIADLDHFKKLNDTYGHLAGDSALKMSARRMESVVRPYDTVGRYGGEEFLLIFPNCEAGSAQEICERVRRRIAEEPMELEEATLTLTASFGLASAGQVRSAKEMIDLADAALYRAKEGGRNRVVIATAEDMVKVRETRASAGAGPVS